MNELHNYINAKLAKVALARDKGEKIEIIQDAALQMQYKDRMAIVFRDTIEDKTRVKISVFIKEESIKYIGGILKDEEFDEYKYPLANKLIFFMKFEREETDGWMPLSAVVY